MKKKVIQGKVHVYGDNIDTDAIISGKYTKTIDMEILAAHVLEDLDRSFKENVVPGDIVVAGYNFGCGSSREQAPLALKSSGVSAILAKSFARIFFRNSINIGLPAIEVPDIELLTSDVVSIDLESGFVLDITRNRQFKSDSLPSVMLEILNAGGLVPYLKMYGNYRI